MDNDAWMVRGSERQDIIERLRNELFGLEDAVGGEAMGKGDAHFFFLITALSLFQETEARQERPPTGKMIEAKRAFIKMALKEIKDFSRVPEEEAVLVIELAKKLLETAVSPIYGALQSAEILKKDKVFS